jgi:hypothetical protein
MALNASGQISIGGSTVGQSINLELGLSAAATSSMNDAGLRTLAGVASGAISLSNFYGRSNRLGYGFVYTAGYYNSGGNLGYADSLAKLTFSTNTFTSGVASLSTLVLGSYGVESSTVGLLMGGRSLLGAGDKTAEIWGVNFATSTLNNPATTFGYVAYGSSFSSSTNGYSSGSFTFTTAGAGSSLTQKINFSTYAISTTTSIPGSVSLTSAAAGNGINSKEALSAYDSTKGYGFYVTFNSSYSLLFSTDTYSAITNGSWASTYVTAGQCQSKTALYYWMYNISSAGSQYGNKYTIATNTHSTFTGGSTLVGYSTGILGEVTACTWKGITDPTLQKGYYLGSLNAQTFYSLSFSSETVTTTGITNSIQTANPFVGVNDPSAAGGLVQNLFT